MIEVSSLPHILILALGSQDPVIQCCSNEFYEPGILFWRYGKWVKWKNLSNNQQALIISTVKLQIELQFHTTACVFTACYIVNLIFEQNITSVTQAV